MKQTAAPWLPALRDADTKSGPAASWVVVGTGYVLRAPRAAIVRTGRDREVLNAVLPWSMAHNHMLRVFAQVETCPLTCIPQCTLSCLISTVFRASHYRRTNLVYHHVYITTCISPRVYHHVYISTCISPRVYLHVYISTCEPKPPR